jgi:hypothetical protein
MAGIDAVYEVVACSGRIVCRSVGMEPMYRLIVTPIVTLAEGDAA